MPGVGVSILETLYDRCPPVLSRLLNIPQPGRLGAGGDDWHDPRATQSTASFFWSRLRRFLQLPRSIGTATSKLVRPYASVLVECRHK